MRANECYAVTPRLIELLTLRGVSDVLSSRDFSVAERARSHVNTLQVIELACLSRSNSGSNLQGSPVEVASCPQLVL